ncbi:MAG: RnfABCDGE type electron transport complex subunit B [Gammaproteobacteria bacterium]
MVTALACTGLLTLSLTLVLGALSRRLQPDNAAAIEQVLRLLPQTQCEQCGYAGCRPYAEAIVNDDVALNRCPPGGEATILALGKLLGRPPVPLDPDCGIHAAPEVAVIDEYACIGCALCLQACPVDAILGARRYMHTVIATECTGCELCLMPCPVDCIRMTARA